MNAKNLLIASTILISSCVSTGVNDIKVTTKTNQKTALSLQTPEIIKTKTIQWVIITPENSLTVFQELQKEGKDLVLFGLTDKGYENLSLNMAEVRKFMITQRKIIQKYKDYYETETEKIQKKKPDNSARVQ